MAGGRGNTGFPRECWSEAGEEGGGRPREPLWRRAAGSNFFQRRDFLGVSGMRDDGKEVREGQ